MTDTGHVVPRAVFGEMLSGEVHKRNVSNVYQMENLCDVENDKGGHPKGFFT